MYLRRKINMIKNNNNAAIPLRKATTAKGENLSGPMAAFPKTGASPRKNADTSAALIPVFRPLYIGILPLKILDTVPYSTRYGWFRYLKRIPRTLVFLVRIQSKLGWCA